VELDKLNCSYISAVLIILAELIERNCPPKNNGDVSLFDKGEWTVVNPYPMQLVPGES
jgi:hypothetical protein